MLSRRIYVDLILLPQTSGRAGQNPFGEKLHWLYTTKTTLYICK